MPTKHAKHGPSSLKNKEICPHWQNRPGSSAAADEGTRMHEAAETNNLEGLNPEQCAQVESCITDVSRLQASISQCTRHNELRLEICGLTFGTADVVLVGSDKAVLIDYKMGRVPVDPAEINLQGWAYALGVFDRFDVELVDVVFLQPRCDTKSVHSFFRTKDYARMKARLSDVIQKAEDENSPHNPHPENCEYCGRKAECPALASKALAIATSYSDELQLPDEMHPSNITDPKQMALALKLAPVLADWAQSVRKHALDMVQDGQEIPGYGLKFRSGQRTIKDILLVWEIIQDEFDVPLNDFLPACSISVTALEKAVKSRQERGKGAAAIRRMNQLLSAEGLCVTGTEVTYLAKER
ncbi:DUF2800 domain-containing protein [Pontiellaceae bacterium B12227]|nr:DUF2800 domain-containing protein [Pontiellaceae bacterium B12227]